MSEEDSEEYSFSSDPDNQYDILRDDSCCELYTDLSKLKKFYVDKPTGLLIYFRGNPQKFWEHIKSHAEFELEQITKKELKK